MPRERLLGEAQFLVRRARCLEGPLGIGLGLPAQRYRRRIGEPGDFLTHNFEPVEAALRSGEPRTRRLAAGGEIALLVERRLVAARRPRRIVPGDELAQLGPEARGDEASGPAVGNALDLLFDGGEESAIPPSPP